MILSRREKTILYSTLTVICLAAVNYLFLSPFEEEMATLDKTRGDLVEKKRKLNRFLDREQLFRRKIDDIEKKIPRSSPEEMSNEFQVHLKELADKARLQVTDNKYLDEVSVMDKYKKMVFAVRFECDIRQLRDYLYFVETSPRLLKVSQLKIVKRNEKDEKLSVNMRLNTLVLAE